VRTAIRYWTADPRRFGGKRFGGDDMNRNMRIAAAGACLALGAALVPAGASAGPCSNDIAELSRILSASPALGAGTPTTGALAGGMPGNTPSPAGGGGGSATPSPDRTAGTSADNRQGGTAGTRELNAAVGNQIATSPDDVRRQLAGHAIARGVLTGTFKRS